MARIQILDLPSTANGDVIQSRYALVVDQAGDLSDADCEALRAFASEAGAQGCVVLSADLDIQQGDDEDEDGAVVDELAAGLQQLAAGALNTQPQKPKLPPVTTTEGRLARVWQGTNPTKES